MTVVPGVLLRQVNRPLRMDGTERAVGTWIIVTTGSAVRQRDRVELDPRPKSNKARALVKAGRVGNVCVCTTSGGFFPKSLTTPSPEELAAKTDNRSFRIIEPGEPHSAVVGLQCRSTGPGMPLEIK
jgi:hypothetical protein